MPTIQDEIRKIIEHLSQQSRVPNLHARQVAVERIKEALMWVDEMYKEINPAA